NGKQIVGGTLSFKAVEASDLFTLSNNVITVKQNLDRQAKIKLIAIYTVDSLKYVGAVDVILEPKYEVSANSDAINFVNDFSFSESNVVINGATINKYDFADLYFSIYKANSKVHSSGTTFTLSCDEAVLNGESVYKVTLTVANASASVYFKLTDLQSDYYYSAVDNRNVYIGGDAINLLNCVGEFYNSNTNEVIAPYSELEYNFLALDDGVELSSDGKVLNTEFYIYERDYSILMSMVAVDGNTYYAVIHILVYPSATINLTYSQAGQSITIAKAGDELNLKDYIEFAPQRSGVRDYVLNNTTADYEVFVFDKVGNSVTSNLSSLYSLSGFAVGQTYSSITPKLSINLMAEGYIFIIKASMQFDEGEISAYYYIKVDGISYSFTQTTNAKLLILGEGDALRLSDFGEFSVGSVTNVKFEEIGSYYEVLSNTIVNTKNLYNKEVEVLISAKYNNIDLFAIAKFVLKTKFVVENIISAEDEIVTSFEVLSTLNNINLLSSNYINSNANEMLTNVTINLFNMQGVLVLSKVYEYANLYDETDYFVIEAKNNGIYLSPLESVDLIGYYMVVQLEYNSLNQYKYVQYNLNFVDAPTGITVTSATNSSTLNISSNNSLNLGTLIVKYGDEVITSSNYNFEYQLSNNYAYVQNSGGNTYLIANPYFTDKTSKLTLTVRDSSNKYIGQGYLNVEIAGVELANNGNTFDLTESGVPYKVDLLVNGDIYEGNKSIGAIASKVYNKNGAIRQDKSYTDYLVLQNDVMYLIENLLVPEDVVIELSQDVELTSRGVTTDVLQYKMIIVVPSSKVALYIDGVKVAQELKGGYVYNVANLTTFNVEFKLGDTTFTPALTLITTNLGNAVSVSGNRITVKELYANATASIIAQSVANSLQTIIDVKFGDYTSYDYSKMDVPAVDVGDKIASGDEVIVYNASTNTVVDNSSERVYSVSGSQLQILKYGYIIVVKSKIGIVVNSSEIYTLSIYKTIEKFKTYDIKLNNSSSVVVDIFTTDAVRNLPLSFVLDGAVRSATFEILDITGATDYLSLNLNGSILSLG
ncbi:MAG: hypothetical protein ACI4TX_01365, partial [Christensenellales bacterium]